MKCNIQGIRKIETSDGTRRMKERGREKWELQDGGGRKRVIERVNR